MLENYFTERKQSLLVLVGKLILLVLIMQLIAYTVPSLVAKSEARAALLKQTLQPVRVIANSSHKADVAQKNALAAQYARNGELTTTAAYTVVQGERLLPPKIEGGQFYPQNVYNATVITIGAGRGDNWFCAMFKQACIKPSQQKQRVTFPYIKKLWRFLK